MGTLLLALLIAYGVLCLLVWCLQRRLIYLPTRLSPHLAEYLAAQEGLRPWRNHEGAVIGWNLPAKGTAIGTVLVFHGNAGCAIDRVYLARPLHEAEPLDVYVVEYPGYGPRPGSPRAETILAAAEEAFAVLPKQRPIYLVAESLGTGAATHLAHTHPGEVRGLMLFAPYDKLASVGQRQFPFLPVSWLLRDRFNPQEWLRNYRGPTGFVLAGADEVIPIELGRRLADSYAGPKRLLVLPGAGHNDLAAQSADWWREMIRFWNAGQAGFL